MVSVGQHLVSMTKWTRIISAHGINLKSQDNAGSSYVCFSINAGKRCTVQNWSARPYIHVCLRN